LKEGECLNVKLKGR